MSRQSLTRLAITLLACSAGGWLGNWFSVPPLAEPPIWPAAGIGLALVLLWGRTQLAAVFLAAVLIQFVSSANSLLLASALAAAQLLQVALSAFLIRQVLTLPSQLESEKDLGYVVVLGGPIGATIAATLELIVLMFVHDLTSDEMLYRWFVMWTANALGVMVMTPLIMIVFNNRIARQRKLMVTIPTAMLYLLMTAILPMVRDFHEKSIVDDFRNFTGEETAAIHEQLRIASEVIVGVGRYAAIAANQGMPDFREMLPAQQDQYRSLRALGFIRFARTSGQDSYVVERLYPADPGVLTLNQDLRDSPGILSALLDASDSGAFMATSGYPLGQFDLQGSVVLLVHPVYIPGAETDTTLERRSALLGFVAGILSVGGIEAAATRTGEFLNLHIFDNYQSGPEATLYGHARSDSTVRVVETIEFAGRQWSLAYTPTLLFMREHFSWQSWLVLVAGVLLAVMLQGLIIVTTARAEMVRRLVGERTRELDQSKQDMEHTLEQLSESNSELEKFAYVASHDLQEPIRMVRNFTELLQTRYGDRLDETGRKYLDITCSSAARMHDLVQDLLEYSRLSHEPDTMEEISCDQAFKYVVDNLGQSIRDIKATVTSDPLPVVLGNQLRFTRLLQNLISNGLKYHAPDVTPRVHVSWETVGSDYRFCIRDNGIGIKPEYHEQIFFPFKRLHHKEQYPGTGIGLSICRKIVELMNGTIWVESEPGDGSAFFFTVPKPQLHLSVREAAA